MRRANLMVALAALSIAAVSAQAQQVVAPEPSAAMKAAAAETVKAAAAHIAATSARDKDVLAADKKAADAKRDDYLQAMYKVNAPKGMNTRPEAPKGEQILMFASMSMQPSDVAGMFRAAAADPRIVVKFLGGEKRGGMPALLTWVNNTLKNMKVHPVVQIDPPSFHKYHITDVPMAVVLRDGKEVARVGGVVDSHWIDEQLTERSGNLGSYGPMALPSEFDLEVAMEDRAKAFDWNGYLAGLRANFWRGLHIPGVPHATTAAVYRIDPTITLSHDIRTPDGVLIAKAGTRSNPLKVAPLDRELVFIDASDPAQRAFAKAKVTDPAGRGVMVISTVVPTAAADGWAIWSQWEDEITTNLYAYMPALAKQLRLTGTPSVVVGDGAYLKVEQISLRDSAHAEKK